MYLQANLSLNLKLFCTHTKKKCIYLTISSGKAGNSENLPLVFGYICNHQNFLFLSSHVSRGCDGDCLSKFPVFFLRFVCSGPGVGCSLFLSSSTDITARTNRCQEWQSNGKLWVLVALWAGSHGHEEISTRRGRGQRKIGVSGRRKRGGSALGPGDHDQGRAAGSVPGIIVIKWQEC